MSPKDQNYSQLRSTSLNNRIQSFNHHHSQDTEQFSDVRAIWLWHLVTASSPGLMRLIWLDRRGSPSSLTAPSVSLLKLCELCQRGRPSPSRRGQIFGQGRTRSCAPPLTPPNKLSRYGTVLLFKKSLSHATFVSQHLPPSQFVVVLIFCSQNFVFF